MRKDRILFWNPVNINSSPLIPARKIANEAMALNIADLRSPTIRLRANNISDTRPISIPIIMWAISSGTENITFIIPYIGKATFVDGNRAKRFIHIPITN